MATILARKFRHMTIKRTEDREFRATYKVETIQERYGVDRSRALEMQERFAAYEATRQDAEATALAMAREWMLVELAPTPTLALLAIAAELTA